METEFIGLVKDGQFTPLDRNSPIKVTEIAIMQAQLPTPLNLEQYEQKVIMISGQDGGDWIYSAKIIDVASPILKTISLKIFSKLP